MTKKIKKITFSFIAILVVVAIAFMVYVSDYYHADDSVVTVSISGLPVEIQDNLTILRPSNPTGTGFIFYPGAKVEETAYLPLLQMLQDRGMTCVLVKMPFHFAIFDSNAASKVMEKVSGVDTWYLGGHSLGGAMASQYASLHQEQIEGLILLAAYPYGDYPSEKTLILYGSEDQVLNRNKITTQDNVKIIDGGNHAQFGSYGNQKGDGIASISSAQQKQLTVNYFLAWLAK